MTSLVTMSLTRTDTPIGNDIIQKRNFPLSGLREAGNIRNLRKDNMIVLLTHLLFAAILSVSMVSHKPDQKQGDQTQCQTYKSK